MTARAPVRFGLVGCGRLSELGYAPAVAGLPGARIVAVADPDADRRALVAGLVGLANGPESPIAVYAGAADLVAAGGVDAVIVASPAGGHVADASVSAAAGLPTLVEKPPAPDAAGARALAALEPRPWVGFNRRFDLGTRRVRAAVPVSGTVHVTVQIAYRRASWRAHAVRDDALLDLGPHVIDLAAWLTGGTVEGVHGAQIGRDTARATLTLDRGDAEIAVACDRPHRELVEVRDARGDLVARHTLGGPVAGVWGRVRPGPHPLVTTLAAQLAAVVRAIHGEGRGALGDAGDAARVMTVLDAVRASASASGRPVLVPVTGERVACS